MLQRRILYVIIDENRSVYSPLDVEWRLFNQNICYRYEKTIL